MPNVRDYVPSEASYTFHAQSAVVSGVTVSIGQVWAKKVGGQRFRVADVDPNFDNGAGRVVMKCPNSNMSRIVTPMTALLADYTLGT